MHRMRIWAPDPESPALSADRAPGVICGLMTVMPVPLQGPVNACRREIEPEVQMSLPEEEV